MPTDRPRAPRRLRALTDFLKTETGSAIVLATATVAALVWANSPVGESYVTFWHHELTLGLGDVAITEDLQHWVNDGLMVLFFFVVGLEVKREFAAGELRDPRAAALPMLAAVGGLVVPAGVYLLFTVGTDAAAGWGIPVATDIAFALGALAVLGRRVPTGLKVFLLTLAIADDIGAILIIAVAFSKGIAPGWLATAVGVTVAVVVLRRWVSEPWAYVPLGIILWIAVLESGVHATMAGVILGVLTPAGPVNSRPVLEDLEHRLHPVSSYVVLPIFALANAGVVINADALGTALTSGLGLGIIVALVIGKTLGISAMSWGALRSGIGRRPLGVGFSHLAAVAPLAGIGFTVSLFIADLTFDDPQQLATAKLAVLLASITAAVVGLAALSFVSRRHERTAGTDIRSAQG